MNKFFSVRNACLFCLDDAQASVPEKLSKPEGPAPVLLLSMHPILPAKNFSSSLSFYSDLGFQISRHSDVIAELHLANCSFLLQDRFEPQWAENSTMHVMVGNLHQWWKHLRDLDLCGRYEIEPIARPVLEPWGQVVLYLTDPSGIKWQFVEAGRCRLALRELDDETSNPSHLRLVMSA